MEDLRSEIAAFVGERNWEQFHVLKNRVIAMSVEVSEIVEDFQWLTKEQSRDLLPEKLADAREEIGDVI
jgi:dCTP diphosphatase